MEGVSEEQQSESSVVVKEIMSLHRERRDLLAALTPGVSVWKRRGPGEEATLVRRLAGKDYAAPVQQGQGQEMEMETEAASTSTEEQLGRYFDSILQDTEDLNHRMLSMAHAVVKPDGAALSSYMADELVNSTSGLMRACKFYQDTDDNEQPAAEEENTFLDLCDKFLREPLSYENELALVVTKEEVEEYEKEVEKEKKMAEERRQQSMAYAMQWQERQKKQRDRYEKEKELGSQEAKEYELSRAKAKEEKKKKEKDREEENKKYRATMDYLKTGVKASKELSALHRNGWETVWGSKSVRCGGF